MIRFYELKIAKLLDSIIKMIVDIQFSVDYHKVTN